MSVFLPASDGDETPDERHTLRLADQGHPVELISFRGWTTLQGGVEATPVP
jgi:hypothetical protein